VWPIRFHRANALLLDGQSNQLLHALRPSPDEQVAELFEIARSPQPSWLAELLVAR
jgi:hypothetical protein